MFRHVVLFRVRDDVADPDLSAAVTALRGLGSEPGVVAWAVEISLDTRKGRVIVEDGTFADADAFHAWRDGDAHRRVAEHMARIADWWVGDYTTPEAAADDPA
ncbi:Dabb family protein [Microbacterium hydrothermale]|uniref:Dabb family protein n=1 Tax=Microbacterium hydrothermale TaxID=857427 RepID=UPI0010A84691|nr:Dabb family protein [Microbacterium hydrothermale]